MIKEKYYSKHFSPVKEVKEFNGTESETEVFKGTGGTGDDPTSVVDSMRDQSQQINMLQIENNNNNDYAE